MHPPDDVTSDILMYYYESFMCHESYMILKQRQYFIPVSCFQELAKGLDIVFLFKTQKEMWKIGWLGGFPYQNLFPLKKDKGLVRSLLLNKEWILQFPKSWSEILPHSLFADCFIILFLSPTKTHASFSSWQFLRMVGVFLLSYTWSMMKWLFFHSLAVLLMLLNTLNKSSYFIFLFCS